MGGILTLSIFLSFSPTDGLEESTGPAQTSDTLPLVLTGDNTNLIVTRLRNEAGAGMR